MRFNNEGSIRFLSYGRAFGKLLLSILTILVVAVAIMCKVESLHFAEGIQPPAVSPLTTEEVDQFKRDGFLVKRRLVSGNDLHALQKAGEDVAHKSFFWTDRIFRTFYQKIRLQVWRSKRDIAKFAFESSLPSIAAQLLGEESSIRILKDALFSHAPGKSGCGFHVDDKGFWPADDESNGVNFWIALSHYTKAEGGGIRVAKGSHKAEWAKVCREIRTSGKTCNMQDWSPTCNERLEQVSETHDLEPGDVVLWDRWMFHTSEPFHRNNTSSTKGKLRYTIRYIPSDARAMGIHHASVNDGERYHGHHYPQVWPRALKKEVDKLADFNWNIKDRLLPFL